MPEISLQTYENEIDELIEEARYLEALAHLRYILSQYPRYIGAYYLLGKTMLEAELPDLAADMFRRALSADPEHLMARIGLGLAHERRDDLDAAIWNLERALELDPGRSEIAEELRRMYGRRDGVDLEYVPQTEGGLARLYLRGHRYGRAVAELRSLLEEDAGRPDLMTALAEAYWRDAQLVQASETSQSILDKLPYHCKANLLLGTLWVNSGQEDGWSYLRRAQEVDLENRLADELFGSESLLSSQEVTLDRLAYDPDALDVDRDSLWFRRLESASITVGVSEAPPEMLESEVRLVDITAGLESQIEIPDWLRELGAPTEEEAEVGGLGWMADIEFEAEGEVSLEESEEPVALEDVEDLEAAFGSEAEIDLADLELDEEAAPDWLEELTAEELPLDLEDIEGAPDWLVDLVGEEAEEGAAAERLEARVEAEPEGPAPAEGGGAEERLAAEEITPEDEDWLRELQATLGEEEEIEAEREEIELAEGEMPDWLAELAPSAVAEEEAPEELGEKEVLDWIEELETEAEADTAEAEAEEEMPDWLAELAPSAVAQEEAPEALDLEEEEIPDWLRELEPKAAETLISEIGELSDEEFVEWLSSEEAPVEVADLIEEEVGAEPAEDLEGIPTTAPEEASLEIPPVPTAVEEPAEEVEGLFGEEALAWLESLTLEEAEVVEEEPVGSIDAGAPLTEVTEPAAEAPAIEKLAPAGEEVPEAEGDLLSGDDALAWLESLAAGKEVELRAQAEVESARRVDEILGRKREAPPAPPESMTLEPETTEAEAETPMAAGEPPELEEAVVPPEPAVEEEEATAPKPSAELPVAEELTAEEEATESELLSGEDALAWLESLAAGKGEELRAQAEAESARRVDEILGRKREAAETEPDVTVEAAETAVGEAEPSLPEVEVPELEKLGPGEALPEEETAAEETAVAEEVAEEAPMAPSVAELPAEPVAEAQVEPAVAEEGELLSGDEAVAWLESLTLGKEEVLKAEAEAASAERVDEILGRKRREAPEPEPSEIAPAEPAPVEEAAAEEAAAEAEEAPPAQVSEIGEPPAEEEEAFFGWTAFGEETVEVGAHISEGEPPLVEKAELGEVEPRLGEDALTWLEGLAPEQEQALRAQVDTEAVTEEPAEVSAAAPAEAPTTAVEPEEEAAPAVAEEVHAEAPVTEEVDVGEPVIEAEFEAEPEASETPETEVEAVSVEAVPDEAAMPPEKAAEPEEVIPEEEFVEAPPEAETLTELEEPEPEAVSEEAVSEEVASEEVAPEEVVSDEEAPETVSAGEAVATEEAIATGEAVAEKEAAAAEAPESELDEMRAHVKRKRSDHDTRLKLARALWEASEIQEAMQHYARLIKSSAKTDEVMADLERYTEEKPNESSVLRTLGDAYMKFGELDRALEIYNHAMDLL